MRRVHTPSTAFKLLKKKSTTELRKVARDRGHFPNDEGAVKLLYLAMQNVENRWTRQPQYWNRALNQFVFSFEGKLPARPGARSPENPDRP